MKLADWLKTANMSKAGFARAVGISPGRVSQLLSGDTPSLDLALRIQQLTRDKVKPGDLSPQLAGADTMTNKLDTVSSAIAAIKAGEMVVVVDDDDRENEGDLIAAASKVTTEQMAMMVRHGSGIVCAPMTREDARRLKLDPMVSDNDAPLGTAFTVSIDYREGLTTGISAKERCATVHALANANVHAEDFVRPGHVFPLIAKRGGVLMRSGHTEAAVDLARLAGEPPVGVICELVNDDGTVKRGAEVMSFAREHGFRIISVADLIAYRQQRERLVERDGEFTVDTPAGAANGIAYSTQFDPVQHLALVYGDISSGENIPVRLHRQDLVEDVLGNRDTLNKVYDIFRKEGCGILVYLREGTAGVPASRLTSPDSDEDTGSARAREEAWRDVGLGASSLADAQRGDGRLGVERRGSGGRSGPPQRTAFWSFGREGAQGVLHPVAELAEHAVGHVHRVLGDEVDTDALGADQPHHLLHLVHQHLRPWRVVEEQVRLVEEEHQHGLVRIAEFRQLLEQLRQQPQQEGGIELRAADQLVGGEHVDHARPSGVGAHQVR
jgi:3,4-dihydroxy 2-butanone 4-phosphate synthase/GTP cyclohydrolase II